MKETEQRVIETATVFMDGWVNNQVKRMYKHCQKTWKKNHKKRELKHFSLIEGYQIERISQKSEALYDVYIQVTYLNGRLLKKTNNTLRIRMIAEKKPYRPTIEGKFGVNPTSIK